MPADELGRSAPGTTVPWLARVTHTDSDIVLVVAMDGSCLEASATVTAILGVDVEDVVGPEPDAMLDPLDRATVRALAAQVVRHGHVRSTVRLHACSGEPVWLDVSAKVMRDDDDTSPFVFVSARDVTDDVLALQHLAESEQRWRLAFENSPIGAALVNRDGDILLANGALGDMLGLRLESLTMLNLRDVTHPDDRDLDAEKMQDLLACKRQKYTVEKRLTTAQHELLWVQLTAAAVPNLEGTVNGVIIQLQDITQRREAELELANRALHDPLTSLPNRFLVQRWLGSALQEHLGRDVGVLYCDLDRFKVVNDSLGHSAGDEVLVEAAARLRSALRPDDLVGRVGGDEFVVVCERVADVNDLLQVAARLSATLDEPISIDGHAHTVTISIGAAMGRAPQSADDLLMRADMALLRAKRLGRARIEVFDETVDHIATRDDLELEEQLRASVGAGELRAYYQPIVTLPDVRVVGHEALLRWEHPDQGLLAPARFLQIAESTGLIRSLGWWMLNRACRDAAVGALSGRSEPTWVAVNASPTQLARHGVFDAVQDTLTRAGLSPHQLHIEITETALMQASATLLDELRQLRKEGVGIVLDDFGTGFSSLSLLRDFPVTMVKIDKSFIAPLLVDPSALAIVRAVVGMSHDLGIATVAEGVETDAQARALADLGCSHAQGYLFGRPEGISTDAGVAFDNVRARLYGGTLS